VLAAKVSPEGGIFSIYVLNPSKIAYISAAL